MCTLPIFKVNNNITRLNIIIGPILKKKNYRKCVTYYPIEIIEYYSEEQGHYEFTNQQYSNNIQFIRSKLGTYH